MKYLCLIYFEESELYSRSQAELDRLMEDHFVYNRDLTASGHLLGTNPLEPVKATMTVRVRNGQLSAIDGPFVETKEQLCGYYLIEARDLNEAIQVTARNPAARTGTIEVRPVRDVRARSNA